MSGAETNRRFKVDGGAGGALPFERLNVHSRVERVRINARTWRALACLVCTCMRLHVARLSVYAYLRATFKRFIQRKNA